MEGNRIPVDERFVRDQRFVNRLAPLQPRIPPPDGDGGERQGDVTVRRSVTVERGGTVQRAETAAVERVRVEKR